MMAREGPPTRNIARGGVDVVVKTILLYYAKQTVITARVNRLFIYCEIYFMIILFLLRR